MGTRLGKSGRHEAIRCVVRSVHTFQETSRGGSKGDEPVKADDFRVKAGNLPFLKVPTGEYSKKEFLLSFTAHQQVQDIYVYISGYLLNPSKKTFFY